MSMEKTDNTPPVRGRSGDSFEIRAHRRFSVFAVAVMFVSALQHANYATDEFVTRTAYHDGTAPAYYTSRADIDTPWFKIENEKHEVQRDNRDRGVATTLLRQANQATFAMPEEEDWLLSEPHYDQVWLIPKILHKVIIITTGDFPEYFDEIVNATNGGGKKPEEGGLAHAHLSWMKMNPGHEIRYYNLHLSRLYLIKYYHPIFLRAFDCIEAFSGKTDFLRALLVYRDGGFYSDWKQECKVDGLLAWLSKDTKWFSAWDQPYESKRMQMAFIGAPPRSPILARLIQITMANLQNRQDLIDKDNGDSGAVFGMGGPVTLGQAFDDVGNRLGWPMPKRRTEFNGNWKKIAGVRLGEFNYRYNSLQRFFYDGKLIIVHKCHKCGQSQDWPESGNNYHEKFNASEFFCPDAPSVFLPKDNSKS